LKTKYGPLDVLAFIEKGHRFEELIAKSTEIDFHGYKVHVLSLETILELKRDSKDPRDRQRLPIYEETLKLIRDKDTS
jgi:predicted nucleotidyltransferase